MRKILSLLGIFLVTAFTSQAQLVSSLNFSTGFDNVTSTTIPIPGQDPNWQITNLTPPFVPWGIMPYPSEVQTPWGPGPTTPAGTEWISFDPTSMTWAGPFDNTGGSITFEYRFETCRQDDIRFNATMRGDNRITDVRVDGVSTGFNQPVFTALNWSIGSPFSYMATLPAGVHTVEVDVLNAPATQPNNPAGINVDGVITAMNNSIIDRDNFPDYRCCNADFRYCFGTLNPYTGDFSADDPSQPGNFDWFVNGMHVGSGPNISYPFPGPGTYKVCLRYTDATGNGCEKCFNICIADNPVKADGSHRKGAPEGLGQHAADNNNFEVAKVYPNPTSSEVNIELTAKTDAAISIQVYDIMGKVVSEQNTTLRKGQKKLTLSVSELPAGVYSLHISDGQTVIKEKIQIEK